ncbi:MAG: transposase [Janthinobacterium lividum]
MTADDHSQHEPITATASAAFAPPAETFAKSRDFAASLQLVPKQMSTAGKQKLGASSRMGDERSALYIITGIALTSFRIGPQ